MATEELGKPSPPPPYPQMIMEAIEALKQAEGANKSSISKYMESKYGEMAAGHADSLTTHLNKMQESGELLFIKNNYLKPGPDAPLKRGRGRPPKPKDPQAEATVPVAVPGPSRGRGRPKKDPNAPAAPKKSKTAAAPPSVSKTGRPRGRPRKVQPQPLQNAVEA